MPAPSVSAVCQYNATSPVVFRLLRSTLQESTFQAWPWEPGITPRELPPFWASAGDDVEAAWLGVSTRYVDSAGFYLEGVDAGEESPRPGRTDSPFELNDSHAHSGQNAVEYVTATGVKSQLYADMGLNRSTREGWAINGNVDRT